MKAWELCKLRTLTSEVTDFNLVEGEQQEEASKEALGYCG